MGAHILVAEDDREIREAIRELLQDDGHRVDCAPDLQGARRAFTAHRPDIVIVDLHLTGTTSEPLIAEWNRLPVAPPIILISADRREAREVGMRYGLYVIDKPFPVSRLCDTIEVALRHVKSGAFA